MGKRIYEYKQGDMIGPVGIEFVREAPPRNKFIIDNELFEYPIQSISS